MVFGWKDDDLAQVENDEKYDGAISSELVDDEGTSIPLHNSKSTQLVVVVLYCHT